MIMIHDLWYYTLRQHCHNEKCSLSCDVYLSYMKSGTQMQRLKILNVSIKTKRLGLINVSQS